MKSTPKQLASLMLVDKKPPPLVTDERCKNDDHENCDDDYDYDVPENNRPIKEDDTTTSNNNKSTTIVESSAANVELLRPLSEQPSAQGDDLSIRKSLGSTMGSGRKKKNFSQL